MCKRLSYSICFLFVLGVSVGAEGATMVAHWRLDNDATDSVSGIDGTLMNGPEFTTDAMVGSHALVLDAAASHYVDFGNPQGLPAGTSPRSLAGWGKTYTVAGGWRWIAAYGSAGTGLAMFIGMNGTSLYGGGYGDDVLEAGFWEVDVWHHICLTYDGSVAKLYADGVEVDSQTKNWNLALGRAHLGRQVNDAVEFWDGLVDDVRIYDYVLSAAEITKLAAISKATRPDPADGDIHPDTWVTMSWTPGGYAVSHDVYLGENFDDVNDGAGGTFQGNQGTTHFVAGFPGFPYPDGLVPGTTYYWRVDEVNEADPNSPWKGDVWSFTVPPKKAYNPNPGDGARFVDLNPTLGWTAGFGAKLHTMYFGKIFDDVNDATQGTRVTSTTYIPGALELDATYYWRVDEFDAVTTHRGNVWSFRTMPDIPVQDPNLVCWWKLDEGQGSTVVDWSGHGNHGTFIGRPQWVIGHDGGALELDGGDDYVNFIKTSGLPAGTSARSMCGWGKTDSVAGGWRWIAAYGSAGTGLAMFIGINGTSLYGGGYGDHVLLSDSWQLGVWRHICLTY
ncbi:MAG: LamG domain-containing protein, partial [Planctomycetota bacterium]